MPRAPAAPPRTRSRGTISSPKCCARARATTRLTTRSTSRRSPSSPCAPSVTSPRLPGDPRSGGLDRAPAEQRWRLRLRRSRLAQRCRRHRRGAPGARGRGRPQQRVCWVRAAGYLIRSQNLDGGFPAAVRRRIQRLQSTAWAIQGLIAAGYDPGAIRRHGSRTPIGYLESLRAPDGSIRYSRTGAQTPVWVTGPGADRIVGQDVPGRAVIRSARAGGRRDSELAADRSSCTAGDLSMARDRRAQVACGVGPDRVASSLAQRKSAVLA